MEFDYKWELVREVEMIGYNDVTERMRVPNGWLYRTKGYQGVTMVFVPLVVYAGGSHAIHEED